MHQGIPYGLHVIGEPLTSRDEAFISVTAKRFANLKSISSLDSARMVYDLPDGGYIVIQDMGGNFRVIAYKTKENSVPTPLGIATDYIPMLYSGVILNATPFETDGVPIKITETTRRRLVNYSYVEVKPLKTLELHRFRIEYDNKFKYFEPQYKGIRTFTQYHKLRATWYSGAMSEVVQVAAGYGRQDFDELPDTKFERATFKLPAKRMKNIRLHVANQRLPAYDGIPHFEGKHQYDYTHALSNAVSFDSEGNPWLLRISGAGVYAMPLPIIPATTAPDFLEYIREVGDDELLHILERFGGLPSGENFPVGKDFQAWYRAGVIIKVCDTSDFYRHIGFYTACCWSFNSQGTEGFNTGYSYSSSGMRYAYGYKMKLELGPAIDKGWTLNAKELSGDDAVILGRWVSELFAEVGGSDHRERAIRYKVMRTPTKELLAFAKKKIIDVDYWENLIAKPIATHTGSVSQVSSGPIYWGSPNPLSFGILKFPEFTGQGCESFDMSMPEYKGRPAMCDTVVFGCYVNDQLTVIKYFLDERTFKEATESNFEKVMIIGDWKEEKTTSFSGLEGYLYTTDFDDRTEIAPITTVTKIQGRDLGYGNPAYSTPPLLYMWGSLGRARYYSFKTEVESTSNTHIAVATCVPALTRDCMLYAFEESADSKSNSEKMEKRSVADPQSYPIWTYDPIFHWIGDGTEAKGEPVPKEGERAYAVWKAPVYNEYSWFAESGNWFNVSGYKDVSSPVAAYTRRGNTHNANGVVIGGESPQLKTYDTKSTEYGIRTGRVNVSITIRGSGNIHKNIPNDFYYDFSPADGGGGSLVYFYQDATWITAGTQKYSSISELKDNGLRCYWGSSKLVDHKSAHCFIGVINE